MGNVVTWSCLFVFQVVNHVVYSGGADKTIQVHNLNVSCNYIVVSIILIQIVLLYLIGKELLKF